MGAEESLCCLGSFLYILFAIAIVAAVFGVSLLFLRWVYGFIFKKAGEAGRRVVAEAGLQEGIKRLNERLANGEIDEAEYQRLRRFLEQQGPSQPPDA